MKVYQFDLDLNNMRELAPKKYDYEKLDQLFNGKSIKDIFDPKNERYVLQEIKTKNMDFYCRTAKLTMSKKAFEILGTCLEKHGEIYPIVISNAPKADNIAYFFNILTILDPYDKTKSEWATDYKGIKYRPTKIVFKKSKITKSLFIIPNGKKGTGYFGDYFCTDGLLPPEEEFYHIYQNSGLKGLRFKEIELT